METEIIAYGYTGSKMHMIDPVTVVFIYGNSVKFFSIKTGATKSIVGTGSGITALNINKRTSRYAYSDKGTSPTIHILSFPDHKEVLTLFGSENNAATSITETSSPLEFEDLCFSRDGSRIAAVTTLPECKLSIWSCSGTKLSPILQIPSIPSITLHGCFNLSFSPRSSNHISVTGYGVISFYKLESNIESYSIT